MLHLGSTPTRDTQGPQESWESLAKKKMIQSSKRAFWTGAEWQPGTIPNDDIAFVEICPKCDVWAGFRDLTPRGKRYYSDAAMVRAAIDGASVGVHPLRAFTVGWKYYKMASARTLGCVICVETVAVCPWCGVLNIARYWNARCTGNVMKNMFAGTKRLDCPDSGGRAPCQNSFIDADQAPFDSLGSCVARARLARFPRSRCARSRSC